MRIRLAHADEWPQVLAVVREAFAASEPRYAELVKRIHASTDFIPQLSFVAELDGALTGNLILSKIPLHTATGEVQARLLSEFAVLPEYRHHGVGAALIRNALRGAERGMASMVLAAGPPSYFQQFGFRRASDLGVTPPSEDISNDDFQMVPLPQYDPVTDRGVTTLPAYFGESGFRWP
ncbi:GNAT family N-acetyltransferase [Cellulomonas timonensis]|uniref:GNAT family N-acetyltransferase n=1 Tax=Cellulomonas timonensis TaxID=1689271 RepID=UPI000AE084D1|nr:N-acetyltransferase [Cellulomonas timonensis]